MSLQEAGNHDSAIKTTVPHIISPTSKRVNFASSTSANTGDGKLISVSSSGPSSKLMKSSKKNLLPRLGGLLRRGPSLDLEKGMTNDAPVQANSSASSHEKPLIARSLSLSKVFSPGMRRTSSLPVTPIAHSNPESAQGGIFTGSLTSDVKS